MWFFWVFLGGFFNANPGTMYYCYFLFRLSSQITEEDALKISAKESASLEDQHLAEALARYHFNIIHIKILKNTLVGAVLAMQKKWSYHSLCYSVTTSLDKKKGRKVRIFLLNIKIHISFFL
jgi:hypothetical protein